MSFPKFFIFLVAKWAIDYLIKITQINKFINPITSVKNEFPPFFFLVAKWAVDYLIKIIKIIKFIKANNIS